MKKGLIRSLEKILGPGNLLATPPDLACYSYDASGLSALPEAVALPGSTEEVAGILTLAQENRIPVFPRGSGSGTTGGSVPSGGGIVVSLARMNRIRSIRPDDLMAEVEPGVITGTLQAEVERQGLFYPPDPASLAFCTIGGNVATGAGGARAVKYGVTRDHVVSVEAVLPGGTVIETGRKTAKGVVGYDLTRLFVGSEGTLGIVTGITLKLLPLPGAVGTALALFPGHDTAVGAITALFSAGILPRSAEYLDSACLGIIRDLLPASVPGSARTLLLLETDGPPQGVMAAMDLMEKTVREAGALTFLRARDREEAQRFWAARRGLSPAIKRLGYPDKISEDICVPRHALSHMLDALERIDAQPRVKVVTFGHAGDGNLHVNCLFNGSREGDRQEAEAVTGRIIDATLALGGTISGEHGVGLTKRPFIGLELSGEVLRLMRGIKAVFDPLGIMNPGKVF